MGDIYFIHAMEFFSLIISILGFFYTIPKSEAIVTDFPFRLCYTLTSVILFIFSSLLGLQKAFGKNVVCFRNGLKDRQQARAINQYCWVTRTYTENEENVHSYYQWVPY